MRRVVFIVPGDIDMRTGGSIYDKRIAAGLRALGWCVETRQPDLASIPDDSLVVVDGLALLGLDNDLAHHAARLRLVPLIHLPLALEVGLDPAEAARRDAIEQRALAVAKLVIATGRVTVDELARRGVDRGRIALVEPGTDPAPIARGSGGGSVALVSVGAVTPGKGHEQLLRALAAVPAADWSLTCAGNLDRDPQTAVRVRGLARELGLDDRVTFVGELDDAQLAQVLDRSDVFALVTRRETYGMAVAEAIARGLPVVSTTVGAIPEIVGDAGVLVAPDAGEALTSALARMLTDAPFRQRVAARARAARTRLHGWDAASRAMAAALSPVGTDV